jgi:hypothetical protein
MAMRYAYEEDSSLIITHPNTLYFKSTNLILATHFAWEGAGTDSPLAARA